MSGMDMSDAFDPQYTDSFSVTRRYETLVNGRSSLVTEELTDLYGTFCAASPNQLSRLPDMSNTSRAISVVTTFHCKGVEEGYQPDIINWLGSAYIVQAVDNYPHLGPGFFQVVAVSTTSQEPAV